MRAIRALRAGVFGEPVARSPVSVVVVERSTRIRVELAEKLELGVERRGYRACALLSLPFEPGDLVDLVLLLVLLFLELLACALDLRDSPLTVGCDVLEQIQARGEIAKDGRTQKDARVVDRAVLVDLHERRIEVRARLVVGLLRLLDALLGLREIGSACSRWALICCRSS